MVHPRIHITGASGTGATTLGARVAAALGVVHLDTDDFYWLPTDPPYTDKRPVAERLARLEAAMGAGGWVLSGSLDGWGDPLLENVDLIVFLSASPEARLARLKAREVARFGARIAPGGDMEHLHASFLIWAAGYDEGDFSGRSLRRHETWLADQPAPVLRLDATRSPDALLAAVLDALA